MKKYISMLSLVVLFFACDDVEKRIYNGNEGDRTFLSFSSNIYDLPVTIDDTGSVEVTINSSTVSSVDRTYAISIVTDETTADAATYNLPATVTIPAGQYHGTFTITAQDNDLVETTPKDLVIAFTPLNENEDTDSTQAIVSIYQVCPITPGTFLGNYMMTQLTPNNPDDGVPVFSTQVVNIYQPNPAVPTSRAFRAVYLQELGIGQAASTVPFSLSCNEVITGNNIFTGLRCGTLPVGVPGITLGAGEIPGIFDVDNDTSFTLTLTEYVTPGGCGTAPYQVTFQFTKQ